MLSRRAVDLLTKIFENPVFLSALSSWFLAQILKSFIMLFRNRPLTAREILVNLFWQRAGCPAATPQWWLPWQPPRRSWRGLTPRCFS